MSYFQNCIRISGRSQRRLYVNTPKAPATATVVFIRHGQSLWNKVPTFSGWCDVPLTQLGIEQGKEAGELLREKGFNFDVAYTSKLQRARDTCTSVIKSLKRNGKSPEIPIISAWQLNERHYGALQGRAKDDPQLITKYGNDQIRKWRREYYARPPPMNEVHPYYEPPPAPLTESLEDCQVRVIEYWNKSILSSLQQKENVLFVAHANTIRAMIAYLDEIAPEDVLKIHIANGVPCVYEIDLDTGLAVETEPSSSKGHWLLSEANQARLVEKLGGCSDSFATSIFHAWDKDSDGVLTKDEIKEGLYSWKNGDVALSALVGKIWEELHKMGESGPITKEKFQKFALLSAKKHNLPFFLQ